MHHWAGKGLFKLYFSPPCRKSQPPIGKFLALLLLEITEVAFKYRIRFGPVIVESDLIYFRTCFPVDLYLLGNRNSIVFKRILN